MAQADGEDSAAVAPRVAAARQRQMQRQAMPNAAIDAGRIDALCALDAAAARFAQTAAQRLNWSSRGLHRALKVARTIADLARRRDHRHGARGRGAAAAPLVVRRYAMKPRLRWPAL